MPQAAIVTGMEHSGTTFLSDLLKSHPRINGGFEGGMLLGNSPADFPNIQPFYDWMQKANNPTQWAVSAENMRFVTAAPTWPEMYRRVMESSPLFSDTADILLDKAPPYMPILDQLMQKVPFPVIVIYKPVLYQYTSYKKRDFTLENFVWRYTHYFTGFFKAWKCCSARMLLVPHGELARGPGEVMRKVFRFLHLEQPAGKGDPTSARLTAGPVKADYDPDKAEGDIRLLSAYEKEVLNKISQDEILHKLALRL